MNARLRVVSLGARICALTPTEPDFTQSRAMAELNVQRDTTTDVDAFAEEYSWWEVIYWIIGIIMIPLVPILMVTFFTPYSGVGGR